MNVILLSGGPCMSIGFVESIGYLITNVLLIAEQSGKDIIALMVFDSSMRMECPIIYRQTIRNYD